MSHFLQSTKAILCAPVVIALGTVPQPAFGEAVDNNTPNPDRAVTVSAVAMVSGMHNPPAPQDVTLTIADDDIPLPGQAKKITVTPGEEQPTLAWQAATNADNHRVQWRSGTERYDESREATTKETSHVVENLTQGTPYTLRVIANRTGVGDGPPSR